MSDLYNNDFIRVDLMVCPACGADNLRKTTTSLDCPNCEKSYRTESGKIYFTESYFDVDKWEGESAEFDVLKRGSIPYKRIDKIDGPRLRDIKKYLKVDGFALNLGSGAYNYDGYVNIDLGRYPDVHIVASLENIPYKDNSIDLLISNSVLEHIYDYENVVNEINRVLKPGGYVYLCVPSQCIRHHEYDYHRWTMPGLLTLLNQFQIVEYGSCRGVAYAIIPLVEALIVYKTKPGSLRDGLRKLWLFVSRPLYRINSDNSPEYIAMSNTIYAIGKKK